MITEKQKAYRKELRKLSGEDLSVFIETFHLKYVHKNRSFNDAMHSAKCAVENGRYLP
tara:strand:- start:145 stop:318 length:174 start_codon:yes stop_codon:yes gene_type:complete